MVDIKSKKYISWEEIDNLVDKLSHIIPPHIDSIMVLPRGGLIPAVILSHKLNLPLVSYHSNNTLIVDDICDSGKTFADIHSHSPQLLFACLHFKPHTSNFTPNFWAELYEEDEWLHYPWEKDDADTIQDYLK